MTTNIITLKERTPEQTVLYHAYKSLEDRYPSLLNPLHYFDKLFQGSFLDGVQTSIRYAPEEFFDYNATLLMLVIAYLEGEGHELSN